MKILCVIGVLCALVLGVADEPTKVGTQVVLLGTGNPNADPSRSGPATAIVVNGSTYLIDCGAGLVRRAAAAKLPVEGLKRVFITHLHSDHTLGLADLLFSPWVLGRTEPLEVFGPLGIKAMCEHVAAAYAEDVDIRQHGGEPANTTGWHVNAHEIDEGVVYRDANIKVKAFAVPHGNWKKAFGYRFETADRVIVISGDTTFTPRMIEEARGADVLVHEVYSERGLSRREPVWQKYHTAYHTSSSDVARIAREAKPKLLVLHHLVLSGETPEQVLREVTASYDGKVVVGNDLDVF